MEVKEGYKPTEVGVIPSDWDVKNLGNIAKVEGGYAFSSKKFLNSGKFQVVKMANLYGGHLDLERSQSFLNEINSNERHFQLKQNDILITLTGTVGKTDYGYSYRINEEKQLLLNQRVARIICDTTTNPVYLGYECKTNRFLKQFFEKAKGGTGNQANVGTNDMEEILIPLPRTKAEQTAIATALNDADALITQLEKLIAKKRNIKQGAMQELLAGNKRLPGFHGKWEVKKLKEIGEITGAGIDKKSNLDEVPIRLVNYLDVFHKNFIYSRDLNHRVTAPAAQAQRCKVIKGDIFFTPSSEMRYDIGISAVAMEDIPDAGYSYHVVRLRLFEDWNLPFRTYIFKTRYFLDQAETICEGSGKRYVISLSKFREMNIYYPAMNEEQTAIATVLCDMDAEIESLEQKLSKYRLIKQGMMQELLTGKTRLV
ncbi:MAG: restriction endonuclease subunit S [Syntrophales bacterium]